MKNYKVSKKLLALLLAVLMVFSTVSLSVSGAQTENETDVCGGQHTYGGTLENVDATCEKDGYQKNICSKCNLEYEVVIKAEGHEFDEENGWVVTQAPEHEPSRIREGNRKNKCLNCNYEKFEKIPSAHEFGDSYVVLSVSTCVTKGSIKKQCKLCRQGVELISTTVNPDNHTYGDTIYILNGEFTCKKDGLGIKVCKDCGDIDYVTIKADAEAYHASLDWKVTKALPDKAVCSDNEAYGVVSKICPECDYKEEEIFTAKHKLKEGTISGVAATCSKLGYETGYCEICEKPNKKNVLLTDESKHVWLNDVVFEKDGCDVTYLKRCANNVAHTDLVKVEGVHTYETDWEVVPASCLNVEYKKNTCTVCENEITIDLSKEYGDHTYDESTAEITEESTCTEVGKEIVWCTTCKKDVTRDYPMHMSTSFVASEIPATCTKEGEIEYKCKECSTSTVVVTPIDSENHNLGSEIHTTKAPTCCEDGIKSKKCGRCGEFVEVEKIPATVNKHFIKAEWVREKAADCYEDGYDIRKCELCDFSEKKIIAKTHNFSNWSYDDTVNCEELVIAQRQCITCKTTEIQKMSGNHEPGDYVFVAGTGDCSTGGVVQLMCKVCKNPYEIIRLEAGEHLIDPDKGTDIEEDDPDNLYCGGKKYTCLVAGCGEEVLKPFEHAYYIVEPSVAPTCLVDGYTAAYACKACDLYVPSEVIEAPGKHSYTWVDANGTVVCTACGIFEGEGGAGCDHFCHNKILGIKLFLKVAVFFWKLFGKNHFCECGAVHYHEGEDKDDNPIVTVHSREYDKDGNLISIKYSCTECKVKNKEYKF